MTVFKGSQNHVIFMNTSFMEKEYSGALANCEVHLCIYRYNNSVTCLFRLVRKKGSVGEGSFG